MAKKVLAGLVTAWRLAGWPTIRSPSSWMPTTEGVVRTPSAFSITFGVLPSMMATHELVVPRSMPIILLMRSLFRSLLADGRKASEASAPRAHPRFDRSLCAQAHRPRAPKGLQYRKPGIERDMGRRGSAARARMRRSRTLAYPQGSPRVALRPPHGSGRTAGKGAGRINLGGAFENHFRP